METLPLELLAEILAGACQNHATVRAINLTCKLWRELLAVRPRAQLRIAARTKTRFTTSQIIWAIRTGRIVDNGKNRLVNSCRGLLCQIERDGKLLVAPPVCDIWGYSNCHLTYAAANIYRSMGYTFSMQRTWSTVHRGISVSHKHIICSINMAEVFAKQPAWPIVQVVSSSDVVASPMPINLLVDDEVMTHWLSNGGLHPMFDKFNGRAKKVIQQYIEALTGAATFGDAEPVYPLLSPRIFLTMRARGLPTKFIAWLIDTDESFTDAEIETLHEVVLSKKYCHLPEPVSLAMSHLTLYSSSLPRIVAELGPANLSLFILMLFGSIEHANTIKLMF